MIEMTKQFWDGHFDKEEREFNDDWIMTPESACEACRGVIPQGGSVLIAVCCTRSSRQFYYVAAQSWCLQGCGMSNLPFLLHDEGFTVTGLDISEGTKATHPFMPHRASARGDPGERRYL